MSNPPPTPKRRRTDRPTHPPANTQPQFAAAPEPPVLGKAAPVVIDLTGEDTAKDTADEAHEDNYAPGISENETDELESNRSIYEHPGSDGMPAVTQTSWPSPFRLTNVPGLSTSDNKDTVSISNILGDVMLREVWLFNFVHCIPWVMSRFDADIRKHVKVVFVHGDWKPDDPAHQRMQEEKKMFPSVKLIAAYMPQMYGSHHSKIMVLIRRDDLAQIVIMTANMIPFDWEHMTQAAWLSPLLPLINKNTVPSPIGEQFKTDFIDYLSHYSRGRTGPLADAICKYSFTGVKAVFIGSVPGLHNLLNAKWGWPKLQRVLSTIPSSCPEKQAKIIAQCSSIATLGQTDKWLTPVFFNALSATLTEGVTKPEFGIIFPTVVEIRKSLIGYNSGVSIHHRLADPWDSKQLEYIAPLLHHWSSGTRHVVNDAGRDRAAPHIKTYTRFSAEGTIDWMLLTSANLSKQAWGEAAKDGTYRICSYEAGVLVHPDLWGNDYVLKPVFRKDFENRSGVVNIRMPYSLPLQKYAKDDEVWSTDKYHDDIDCRGAVWNPSQ